MNAYLWTVVVLGALNVLAVVWGACIGEWPNGRVSGGARALAFVIDTALACWALWLLAKAV